MMSDYLTDEEGFLEDPACWDRNFALLSAEDEKIELSHEHWELILLTRDFYQSYGFSPSMRALVKYIAIHLSAEKGKSLYLMQLFPPSPARMLCKLAGLHKPKNCL